MCASVSDTFSRLKMLRKMFAYIEIYSLGGGCKEVFQDFLLVQIFSLKIS